VLEKYGPKFGKRRVGVYCFRFRHLDEIDPPLLEDLVENIAKLSDTRAPGKPASVSRRTTRG